MDCRLADTKSTVMLLIGPLGTNFSEILIEIYIFYSRKLVWKRRLPKDGNFVSISMSWQAPGKDWSGKCYAVCW